MEESGRHVAIFTAMTNDVLENACKQLLLASTHFCSGLVHIFALGSYTILLLARTQFCSWLVRNFALGSYEAPYGTKLIFFYRYDVVHVHTHFSNRSDRFLQSHRRTLLIELMVSAQISLF